MAERIHVAQMVYTLNVEAGGGGLSRFAIELAQNLNPELFDSSLVSLGYADAKISQDVIQKLHDHGINTFISTSWDDSSPYLSFYRSLNALSTKFELDPVQILHSHSEFSDISAILLKARKKAPLIMRTVHYGHRVEWQNNPLRRLLLSNFLYPLLFNHEIGINQFNTDRLSNRWMSKFFNRKATCIPNAIAIDKYSNIHIDTQIKKQSLGIPPDAQVIGTVGRLAAQKGFSYLLDAVPKILENYPNVYFWLIGDGPLADDLYAQAESLGISSRVSFLGRRADIDQLLACMDLFVSSSLWEGIPTVILESMASAVPVVATSIPGTTELVQHNVNGWLVAPQDPGALSEGIIHLLKSPPLRQELVDHGLETVQKYSIKSIAEQYEQLYLRAQIDK